jgi:4-alpha-glucanotransferase
LLASGRFAEFLPDDGEPVFGAELGEAILAYLARARARLMLVQIEDVAGADEQANLPGTTEAHPNWRRRLSARLEDVLAGAAMARVAALVTAARRLAAPGAAPE